jgi:hypothetical protein
MDQGAKRVKSVLGPFEYVVWALCTFLEAGVVVCALARHSFRKYFLLNIYMASAFIFSLARFQVMNHYGFSSVEYFYFYYYSDALLTIGLYFALINLYSRVLEELQLERYVRLGALLLLCGTALFSYAVVQGATTRLLTRFVVELGQNLYFVGLVLTYLLWGAILKLRDTRARLIQMVLSLGVYFSAFAANYALRNLYPPLHEVLIYLLQFMGLLLPLAWLYAFWRLPEEARLAPSRLAVIPR